MKSPAFLIFLLFLISCSSPKTLVDCQVNSLRINGAEQEIGKISAEKTNQSYSISVMIGDQMLQVSFDDQSQRASLLNFKESPMMSAGSLKVDYEINEQRLNLKAAGKLIKEDQEQSFEICVKEIEFNERSLQEE